MCRSIDGKQVDWASFFFFCKFAKLDSYRKDFFPSPFLFISFFLSFSRSIILSRKKMENNQFFERSGSSKKLDRRRKDRGNVD